MSTVRGSYTTEAGQIRAAKNGDQTAYALLYESYVKDINKFISGKISNKQDAEDLTDEVFLRAWKSLSQYTNEGKPFSAYLYRIARNLVITHFRKEGNWQNTPIDTSSLLIAVDKGPAELYADEVLQQDLYVAISKLKTEYRDMVLLRFVHGLTIAEIADYTGRSEGTVRVINHRALKALRNILNEMDLT